jgi:hypothetical protein
VDFPAREAWAAAPRRLPPRRSAAPRRWRGRWSMRWCSTLQLREPRWRQRRQTRRRRCHCRRGRCLRAPALTWRRGMARWRRRRAPWPRTGGAQRTRPLPMAPERARTLEWLRQPLERVWGLARGQEPGRGTTPAAAPTQTWQWAWRRWRRWWIPQKRQRQQRKQARRQWAGCRAHWAWPPAVWWGEPTRAPGRRTSRATAIASPWTPPWLPRPLPQRSLACRRLPLLAPWRCGTGGRQWLQLAAQVRARVRGWAWTPWASARPWAGLPGLAWW